MAEKSSKCEYNKPNENFTTLPTKDTGDKDQGSLKHNLPTHDSKYGKGK